MALPFIQDVLFFSITMQLASRMNKWSLSSGFEICKYILLMSIPTPETLEAQVGCKIMHWCSLVDFETSENVKGTAFWRGVEVFANKDFLDKL